MSRHSTVGRYEVIGVSPVRREADLEALARWMDSAFEIPGLRIRFGLDAIVGLIPGIGDAVSLLVSLYIMGSARRQGVARITMAQMAANIAIDLILGAVPLLGDVFDVAWKANDKNVALLRRHLLSSPVEERRARSGDWLLMSGLVLALIVLLSVVVTLTYLIIAWIGQTAFPAAD